MEPAPEFGGEVLVLTAGKEGAPPLVLIHGLGPGSADFDALLPALSARYRVLAFDLPGFGRSTHARQLYTPERYARFIHAMVQRHFAGVRSVAMVGHSMGGALAIEYAGRYPDEVHKLALLDVAGLIHYRAYTRMLIGETPAHHSRWQRTKRSINGVLFDVGMFPLRGLDLAKLELSEGSLLSLALGSEQLAAIAFIKHDFGPALHAVRAATWLGWGSYDTVAPLRSLDALRYALRAQDYRLFTNSAHNPMRSEPAAVLGAVQAFLDAPVITATPSTRVSARYGLCDHATDRIFEGDFDSIDVRNCKDVLLRDVRVRRLRVEGSSVVMTRVNVEGGEVAVTARGSVLVWTGGRAQGALCLDTMGSQLDFMAVDLECPMPLRVRGPSQLQSSISRMQTPPAGYKALHGEAILTRTVDEPLALLQIEPQVAASAHRGRPALHDGALAEARLRNEQLAGAQLERADLSGTDLRNTDLRRAQLQGANLTESQLAYADLSDANLSHADLSGSSLVGVKLLRCTLREAKLIGSNLRGAQLAGADLTGADLRDANLRDARFTGARYDRRSRFPEGFSPVERGLLLSP